MGTRSLYNVPIVFWSLLTLLIHILIYLGTNGFSIKLTPRYSINSVLFPKNLSQQDLRPSVWNYENFYAATVAIGPEPYYVAQLLVDTGSDDTWVQGEGCDNCFDLISGNFKYKESNSYTMVSCDHPLCVPRICIENVCHYSITYADGSYTEGILSSDTFTVPIRNGVVGHFENVIFGVGLDNSKSPFMDKNNVIGGILGLGRGPRSILRQLKDRTQLRFSYCLFDLNSGHDTYTYLHFGEHAQIIGNDQETVQTTPLLPDQKKYYVQVLGFTMNKDLLPIDEKEFQLRKNSEGGFIIDSGALVSYLVPKVYKVVRDEIVRNLKAYDWNPLVNSDIKFDLCYNVQPTENQKFPSLGIKFLNANLELGSHRVFKLIKENIYCMAIKPTSSDEDANILGAVQQQDYRFLFDIGVGLMKFVPEKCKLN